VRYERRFSEGTDTGPLRGFEISLEAFVIVVLARTKPLEGQRQKAPNLNFVLRLS